MSQAVADLFWTRSQIAADEACVHALVIGVSQYEHLIGGTGQLTKNPLLANIGQLSAAATSAARVAAWLRDNFTYPEVNLGSVRLLASPSPSELPLPGELTPPPATYDEVQKAVYAWRQQARATPGNITLLYVAGHGIQTTNEGGILLLQDAGRPDRPPLQPALDLGSIRRGMVADRNDPETSTPPVQYYFFDACRVQPPGVERYEELAAGITFDAPRGPAPEMSGVLWGSRSGDYALADPETKATLFSEAFTETLEERAEADDDGRTVRFYLFGSTMEDVVRELADAAGEQQQVVSGSVGSLRTPVYLRPQVVVRERYVQEPDGPPRRGQQDQEQPEQEPTGHIERDQPSRPVMFSTAGASERGITVRADTEVVESVTGRPVDLHPGTYRVSVDQPWGGTASEWVTVPAGDERLDVAIDAAAQPAGSAAGAPRVRALLGPSGGRSARWFLRFLTWTPEGLRHRPDVTAPAVEVDDADDDTVAMIMHGHNQIAQYVQIATEDGRSLVVGLPIVASAWESNACWLHVRVSATTLGAAVRFTDPTMDTCAGYLLGGRPDHVLALAESAEDMLMGKVSNPIGAALGGYALLRLNDLERLHDWPDNLAQWFDWLPDGAVIAAETAARRGDDDRAQGLFSTALGRGVPLFTEGLSLIGNRLPLLISDPDLAAPVRKELHDHAQPILTFCPMAEFGAVATTLAIDPDPGPVTEEAGWRRFVHAHLPDDPRDFWSKP
jgi:hypothetical protein